MNAARERRSRQSRRGARPAASRRPTACPTRTVAAIEMPNGTMNMIDGDLQRDLMRGERGGADPAHQMPAAANKPYSSRNVAGDRRADDDQLASSTPSRSARSGRARDIS